MLTKPTCNFNLALIRIGILGILFLCGQMAWAESDPPKEGAQPSFKSDMRQVYVTFRELQKFMYNKDAFESRENEEKIGQLLRNLSSGFHRVGFGGSRFATEPGFASTLKVLNDMLDDARNRFFENKKGYSLWRLKTSSNYCVSCHTRFEVALDFAGQDVDVDGLGNAEQGEFFLASRQFDKARNAFMAAALEPGPGSARMDALRKWLIIYTRVQPDPLGAIQQINKLRSRTKFTPYEEDEIKGWLQSLRRWANEPVPTVPPLAKAENLVRQGLGMNDPISGQVGTVELLRASGMLHKILESKESAAQKDRAHVLYLLGLTYSELPFFFINELPEMFLEQCIRDYPGSADAKKSYGLYKNIITIGYTGSGGTRLPEDVQLSLKELHDLAYGVPVMKNRV